MKSQKKGNTAAEGARPKAGFRETQALVRDCLQEMAAGSLSFSRSGLRAVHRIAGGEPAKVRDLCRFVAFTLQIQGRQRAGRFFVLACAKSLFPKEAGRLQASRAVLLALLLVVSLLAGQPEQTAKILALLPLPGKQGVSMQSPPQPPVLSEPVSAPVGVPLVIPPGQPISPEKEQETAGRPETVAAAAAVAVQPPEYLGEIVVYEQETLGDMIRYIYGPRTFNKQNVAAILALNPQVANPDIIQPGVPILFPFIPVRLPPRAEQLWWVRLIRTRDIQNAFRFLAIFKDIAPSLLVIPSPDAQGDLLFNIVLEEPLTSRPAADEAAASLSAVTFPGITVLNGLARGSYLYQPAEEDGTVPGPLVAAAPPAAMEPAVAAVTPPGTALMIAAPEILTPAAGSAPVLAEAGAPVQPGPAPLAAVEPAAVTPPAPALEIAGSEASAPPARAAMEPAVAAVTPPGTALMIAAPEILTPAAGSAPVLAEAGAPVQPGPAPLAAVEPAAAEPVVVDKESGSVPTAVPFSRLRILALAAGPATDVIPPAAEPPVQEAARPAALPIKEKIRPETTSVVEEDLPVAGELSRPGPAESESPGEPAEILPSTPEPAPPDPEVETVDQEVSVSGRSEPVKPVRMPEFLGEVVVYEQDTLGAMIRIIYGPHMFTKGNVAAIMALNPQLFDPDMVQPGRSILFPVLPVKLDPQAERLWWVRLLVTEDFRKAFSVIRKHLDAAPPMLLIPSLNAEGELLFNIILEKPFKDREAAGAEIAGLPAGAFPERAILNGLHRGVYFYQ